MDKHPGSKGKRRWWRKIRANLCPCRCPRCKGNNPGRRPDEKLDIKKAEAERRHEELYGDSNMRKWDYYDWD